MISDAVHEDTGVILVSRKRWPTTIIYSFDIGGYARLTSIRVSRPQDGESRSPPNRRVLLYSDVRCYECSVRRDIVRVCRSAEQTVKHGKLPVSISSII